MSGMSGVYWDGTHFFFRGPNGQHLRAPREAEVDLTTFMELFRVKFGRDSGPGDPVIFDPTKHAPVPMPEEDIDAGLKDLLAAMCVHPAHRYAHEQLGYVLTADNAPFSRPEDIKRWNEAVRDWCGEHPQAPPPPLSAISIQPVQRMRPEPTRQAPEYAAVQETLAYATHIEEDCRQLVAAVILVSKEDPRHLRVCYWYSFVQARRAAGQSFRPRYVIHAPTLHAFHRQVMISQFVPVAIAFGDAGEACSFLPVRAGVAIAKPNLDAVCAVGMAEICALVRLPSEAV